MTKSEALYQWMSGFGLPAYPEDAVPSDTVYPWLTFSKGFGENTSITVHLYYHTTSESVPDAKAEEICSALRKGGVCLTYEGGALWLTLDSPEWSSVPDEDATENKHRVINIGLSDTYNF